MTTRKLAKKAPIEKSCKEITDLVLDYLNDKLNPKIKREFVRHLRLCPDCVSFLNTYKKMVVTTGAINSEEIPADVRKNILNFLRKRIYRSGKGFLLCIAPLSLLTFFYL